MKWMLIVVIAYFFLLGYIYFFQRQLIYFPQSGDIQPATWGLSEVSLIQLNTADHVKLHAWFHPPANHTTPTIVYFHGNKGHIGHRAERVKGFVQSGFGLLLLSYRGYGGSQGKPSEQGLYEDARAALYFLNHRGIQTHCIVLLGESLGTGVAVQMAREFQVGALVLQSPYTSLADAGKKHYPMFPIHTLLRDRFDSIQKMKEITIPVLVIHGDRDFVVPITLGKKIYTQANEPKTLHIYPGGGHSDLPDITSVVIDFLKKYQICQTKMIATNPTPHSQNSR